MTTPRMFPVLWPYVPRKRWELERLGCPRAVPWDAVAPHEARALHNHYQTLERLAERGGLSPAELVAVLADEELETITVGRPTDAASVGRLLGLLAAPVRHGISDGYDAEAERLLERLTWSPSESDVEAVADALRAAYAAGAASRGSTEGGER